MTAQISIHIVALPGKKCLKKKDVMNALLKKPNRISGGGYNGLLSFLHICKKKRAWITHQ